MKPLKIAGAILGAGIVLVLIAAGFITSRPGGDFIKARLAAAMQQQKQRTLKIDGALELSLWPTLGLKLGRLSLSERGSAEEFAAIDSVRLSVALQPLLSSQVVVDDFEIDGVRASLIRHQDGTLNIDDFFPQEKALSAPLQFDIAAIKLDDIRLTWQDEKSGGRTNFPGVTLASSRIQADSGRGTFRVASLSASLTEPRGQWHGKLLLPTIEGSSEALTLEKFSGDFAFAIPQMQGKQVLLPFEGQLHVDRKNQTAAGQLAAKLGQSKLVLKFATVRFAPVSLGFDLDVDSLDLDDYLPEQKADAKEGSGTFDLAFLEDLDVHGTVRIDKLIAAGVTATGLQFQIKAANGRLDIAPLAPNAGRRVRRPRK